VGTLVLDKAVDLVDQHLPVLAPSGEVLEHEITQPLLMKYLRVYTYFQPDIWMADDMLRTGLWWTAFRPLLFRTPHPTLYPMSADGRLVGTYSVLACGGPLLTPFSVAHTPPPLLDHLSPNGRLAGRQLDGKGSLKTDR
jgi:hypothetical protein